MTSTTSKMYLVGTLLAVLLSTHCQKQDVVTVSTAPAYHIDGKHIMHKDHAVTYRGVNALQTYGLNDPKLMQEWNNTIVREFIGNLGEQPISGSAVLGSDSVWYHPLQTIVDQNRAHGQITILCPFGWVHEDGTRTLFTGLNPMSQVFYPEYRQKMRAIARHFREQPDVWLEVWNEPFHWNNDNMYSHQRWLVTMQEMVANIRAIPGFENIIVVPGNEQGQSADAILAKGHDLLRQHENILFDLHAYEKWLLDRSEQQIAERIMEINDQGFAILFGEVGVQNASGLMPVDPFLRAAATTNVSVLAWLWNKNSQDPNALLTDEGLPNDAINNNWGSTYLDFLQQ